MIDSLQERVKKYILEHQLIGQGDGVVVGISGGPDSLCLAHILLGLREGMGFEICLAHLNHSLRGEESEEEMDFVSRLSREWDVTAIFERADVYAYIFKKGLNLEEMARNLRYNFFSRAAFQFNTSKVAVGHTADDQVETVLMHILRGSGMRGIRGMSPLFKWRGESGAITVVRPLLNTWRKETEEYCRLHSLEPRLDSSNTNRAFLRNRLRLELVPYLQNINPGAKEAILRLAQITAEEGDYLEGEVEKLCKEYIVEAGPALFLNTDKIISQPSALQRLLLLKALEKITGSARDLEAHHIERLRSALGSGAGKKVSLPRGLLFLKDYEGGWLCHNEKEVCPFPAISGEQEIPLEGQTTFGGWKIATREVKVTELTHPIPQKPEAISQNSEARIKTKDSGLSTLRYNRSPQGGPDSRLQTPDSRLSLPFRAFISLDRTEGKLHVRKRRPGDRFQPLGMEGSKKLQDFMTDEKIPRWWRDRIPLLCSGEDILWVAGWRISEKAKVREGDEKIVEVELQRSSKVNSNL